jgi:hypothetical protein
MKSIKRRLNRKKSIKRRIKRKNRKTMKGGTDLFTNPQFIKQKFKNHEFSIEELKAICGNTVLKDLLTPENIAKIKLKPLNSEQITILKQMLEDFKSAAAAAKTDGDETSRGVLPASDGDETSRSVTQRVVSAFSSGLNNDSTLKKNIRARVAFDLWKINVARKKILHYDECNQKIFQIICNNYCNTKVSIEAINSVLNKEVTNDDITKALDANTQINVNIGGGGRISKKRKIKKLKGGDFIIGAIVISIILVALYFIWGFTISKDTKCSIKKYDWCEDPSNPHCKWDTINIRCIDNPNYKNTNETG